MSNRWETDNFIADVSCSGEKFKIIHAQDIDPYLKSASNQRRANWHGNAGYSDTGNMRKIASIPDVMYTKLIKDNPELAADPNLLVAKIKELKAKGLDFTTVEKI